MVQRHRPYRRRNILDERIELRLQSAFGIDQHSRVGRHFRRNWRRDIFDFTATGTYIHPPQTKDITDIVTWQSDNPQVVQVSSTGVVTPNVSCGLANISATYFDSPNQVTSNVVPITVNGPAADGCTPAGPQPILTVTVTGTVSGNVTSSPAGISCNTGSSCSSEFTTGQSITLNATPASGFQSWQGCNATNGATCTVFLENSTTVTAIFN